MLDFLREENIDPKIIDEIMAFREKYGPQSECPGQCSKDSSQAAYRDNSKDIYYGKEVWEQAARALLCGKSLLLVGDKATGKNMLAENLAHAFGRPLWNVSFHINMDASYMIGTDTFRDGQVTFRPGPVYESALKGGFCVLDEINMARNEALAVLHSALDFRRVINVPGYDSICVHPAARFIATMNYGYAGTRELNEALTSRFMVIHMPQISAENLEKLIRRGFPTMKKAYVSQFAGLFNDIEKKCESGELSSRVLDLRGMLDAISLMESGLAPVAALDMGMTNKTFDPYEQTLVRDVIAARIPAGTSAGEIFAG